MKAKNEYHKRVSPIVLNGGLPRLIHNPAMNAARTITEDAEKNTDSFLDGSLELFTAERTAATEDSSTEEAANQMNISQLTIESGFRFRAFQEQHESTGKHHDYAGHSRIFPRFTHHLHDTRDGTL